jgi:hypothetical protein
MGRSPASPRSGCAATLSLRSTTIDKTGDARLAGRDCYRREPVRAAAAPSAR